MKINNNNQNNNTLPPVHQPHDVLPPLVDDGKNHFDGECSFVFETETVDNTEQPPPATVLEDNQRIPLAALHLFPNGTETLNQITIESSRPNCAPPTLSIQYHSVKEGTVANDNDVVPHEKTTQWLKETWDYGHGELVDMSVIHVDDTLYALQYEMSSDEAQEMLQEIQKTATTTTTTTNNNSNQEEGVKPTAFVMLTLPPNSPPCQYRLISFRRHLYRKNQECQEGSVIDYLSNTRR